MDAAQANEPEETNEAATKAAVFCAAERLFALHGFQNVSVRDITAAAGKAEDKKANVEGALRMNKEP